MNDRTQRELKERVAAFATDVTALLTRAVADAVAVGLSTRQRTEGRQGTTARRPKSGRGSSFDVDTLLAEVKRGGGRRMEQLAKSLRTNTKSLSLPMKKLLAAKKVKRRGAARGTKYTAA